jgi:nicotinamidase-related amidase
MPKIRLPWHIYRHYPTDLSRWREAATGFGGWDAEERELDLSRTTLALMHLPTTGLTADTEFGPDCLMPDALGTVEWVPRTMDLMVFRLPRLVRAARSAGLQVTHVLGAPTSDTVWEASAAEFGEPPPPDLDALEDRVAGEPPWRAGHRRDVFDLPRPPRSEEADARPGEIVAVPEVLLPQTGDLAACASWQLHRLLASRGIDHILYCGWALNWCLWFSPGGMADMSRKGYMCSAVRGGCVAIESRESAVGERNLEYAYWKTSTMFGYVFDLHELTGALRRRAGEG